MNLAASGRDEIETTAHLRLVIGRLSRNLRRTQAGARLTSTETTVLGAAVRNGPVGLTKLANAEGMNPTMLSRVVRHLEEGGLVVRRADPDDKRAGFVEATPAGRRLDERIHTERTDALHRVIAHLEPDERSALNGVLPILERIATELTPARP
jgi:DNA-binding MarR family transcriptional regulator